MNAKHNKQFMKDFNVEGIIIVYNQNKKSIILYRGG